MQVEIAHLAQYRKEMERQARLGATGRGMIFIRKPPTPLQRLRKGSEQKPWSMRYVDGVSRLTGGYKGEQHGANDRRDGWPGR